MKKTAVAILCVLSLLFMMMPLHAFAAEEISLDAILDKQQGESVTIKGSTTLDEVTVRVLRPNQSILYVNVLETGSFADTFTLPSNTPLGTYTVAVGEGNKVSTITFLVKEPSSSEPSSSEPSSSEPSSSEPSSSEPSSSEPSSSEPSSSEPSSSEPSSSEPSSSEPSSSEPSSSEPAGPAPSSSTPINSSGTADQSHGESGAKTGDAGVNGWYFVLALSAGAIGLLSLELVKRTKGKNRSK